MATILVRIARNRSEIGAVLSIRKTVFVRGQHVPLSREMDGTDEDATHVIAYYGVKPVGCARIRFIAGKAKVERMAVLARYRSKGIGCAIMRHILAYLRRRSIRYVYLHSQFHIREFYKNQGFKEKGRTFIDAGMKHVAMTRRI